MNKPSERIVVFVTPGQKRAIAASAEKLGISVSELMKRAVLSFGATSEQVKAASIVDRLRAPREPDALNEALQRVARGSKHARAALPPALQVKPPPPPNPAAGPADTSVAAASSASRSGTQKAAEPMLPAGVLAALRASGEEAEALAAAAEAERMADAAKAALRANHAEPGNAVSPRRRVANTIRDEDDSHGDPTPEGGQFA